VEASDETVDEGVKADSAEEVPDGSTHLHYPKPHRAWSWVVGLLAMVFVIIVSVYAGRATVNTSPSTTSSPLVTTTTVPLSPYETCRRYVHDRYLEDMRLWVATAQDYDWSEANLYLVERRKLVPAEYMNIMERIEFDATRKERQANSFDFHERYYDSTAVDTFCNSTFGPAS
jgi:hypothetical protein